MNFRLISDGEIVKETRAAGAGAEDGGCPSERIAASHSLTLDPLPQRERELKGKAVCSSSQWQNWLALRQTPGERGDGALPDSDG
ncbi:hypothetical protein DD509_04970 [Dehalogenimonas alkenigignens]|nr:hypothetical protein DD509_04970 [Dehalogenimonas alkenigignens]